MVEILRPSQRITVGPTTSNNRNMPVYFGHVDDTALHMDAGANIGSLGIQEIGKVLEASAAPRKTLLQANTGGYREANAKLLVGNYFPYEERVDDHHAPVDWGTYLTRTRRHDGYMQNLIGQHRDTYVFIEGQSGLVEAMIMPGRIGVLKSVEGMSKTIGSPVDAAADLAGMGIKVVNLMWNENTDVGDSHTTSEDNGLTRKGAAFLRECEQTGIPVFDISHASPKTAQGMIDHVGPNRRVIASHTGARIHEVSGRTRNVADSVARAVFERDGIVGVALAGGMLADTRERPATVDDVVRAIDHFVDLDPTGGKLVTIGADLNGVGLSSKVEGAGTVLEVGNIAEALRRAGYSEDMVTDIFWRNGYDFWHNAFADANQAA